MFTPARSRQNVFTTSNPYGTSPVWGCAPSAQENSMDTNTQVQFTTNASALLHSLRFAFTNPRHVRARVGA